MSDDSAANAPAPTEVAAPAISESATNAEIAQTDNVKSDAVAETKEPENKTSEEETGDKAKTEDSEKNGADTTEPAKSADDVEMKDSTQETAPGASATDEEKPSSAENEQKDEGAATNAEGAKAAATPTPADKNKSRRKSAGASGSQTKKLNKKASKAKLTNLNAEPGDYFFVKLKGHPQWPAVICDDDMLPQTLIKSRPVTAARADGTYREDYADGGKRAHDRTFPVMYLYTNEFSWVRNTDLLPLDASTVMDAINDKMRKDLKQAYEIASNALPLDHFKDILQQFQEDLAEKAKQVAEAVVATPKKTSKKGKAAPAEEEQDEDMEMPDADEEEEAEEAEKPKKSSKKRKAEEDAAPPQESAKKTKIKITSNSTPKAANGAATPKSTKATEPKSAKSKSKPKSGKGEEKKAEVQQKEPELTPEEKHQRKEKEVLFLRHKLQKGLLARDEEPKEEEMKTMSEYVTKLETFPDLEVDIIRKTKINKVLKAILKLGSIPKETEFKFKDRSQSLLEKWNKLLADESTPANGVNGKSAEPEAPKDEPKDDVEHSEKTNGTKANGVAEDKEESKAAAETAEGFDAAPKAVETEA